MCKGLACDVRSPKVLPEATGELFIYHGETEQFWIPIVPLIQIRSHVG